MKKLVLLLMIASVSAALSCRRASGNEKRYDLKGTIVSVQPEKRQVTITHEDVKGYMPGMTMPFNIRNDSDMQMLVPNAEITATLVVDGSHSWLEDLFVVTKQAAGPPVANAVPAAREGAEIPNYTLVNQDAKPISIKQYRGRTLLLTFVYTRCPDPEFCTLMSNNFAQIERQLAQDAELYAKTHLLSITFDPEYDEPKVLRSYGAAYTERYENETFAHWEFATGSKEEITEIARYFGLSYSPIDGKIVHGLRTAIIDPNGKIAKVYTGNEWKTEEVVEELKRTVQK